MLWLEMSRDEIHGGGDWLFTNCLWAPSLKKGGGTWTFWESLLQVEAGDTVLHLRGTGRNAAFVGFSTADANGFETSNRPPSPGQWDYSGSFYYVPLKDFAPFTNPIPLHKTFLNQDNALRNYFAANKKLKADKKRLFYVIQAGRLQCLNGAYLSEVDDDLAKILLSDKNYLTQQNSQHIVHEVNTGEQVRNLLSRVGQKEFSDQVLNNYGHQCCFPQCTVGDSKFLVGAHIARWADVPDLRGAMSNGLCLCLMHDKAFEMGLFTISFELRVWVNRDKAELSSWGAAHLLPFHGQFIRTVTVSPSEAALAHHWERTMSHPEF
ncbi:MAG TPA: HNH endonuclease [Pyrinomonadaceae bacterium]|nr:HNH endonuclease [Pyrinomonadaceae bacterium]